jgi:hypothetical protein
VFNGHVQKNDTLAPTSSKLLSRRSLRLVIALSGLGWSASTTQAATRFSPSAVAAMSPAAEVVRPFDAIRLAKDYVGSHAGTDFLVGSGDSMPPSTRITR